jgi:hypothetical protein
LDTLLDQPGSKRFELEGGRAKRADVGFSVGKRGAADPVLAASEVDSRDIRADDGQGDRGDSSGGLSAPWHAMISFKARLGPRWKLFGF